MARRPPERGSPGIASVAMSCATWILAACGRSPLQDQAAVRADDPGAGFSPATDAIVQVDSLDSAGDIRVGMDRTGGLRGRGGIADGGTGGASGQVGSS